MRTRGRRAEQFVHCFLDVGAHDVLPLAGLMMRFRPRQHQHISQEPFGEPMSTNHTFCQPLTSKREDDRTVVGQQSFGFQFADHFADRWAAHVQAFGDTRLDDVDVVLSQFEDAFAVLLECGMVLSGGGHAVILRRSCCGLAPAELAEPAFGVSQPGQTLSEGPRRRSREPPRRGRPPATSR